MLANIVPEGNRQLTLLGASENVRPEQLMKVLDGINERYGRGALRLAAEGVEKPWQMRRGNLSPGYTTNWNGLATVRAV